MAFEGFTHTRIATSDPQVTINLRHGGNGPPLLLLHGNPLTHHSWHRFIDRLAQRFTCVAVDLRGYGESSAPKGLPDHSNYTFRRMALDQVEVMAALGYRQFQVAGHDRGARVAFRMAIDHPETVTRVAFMDILPTHHVFAHSTREWGLNSYHWLFMAQPYDFPERLLAGNEEYYLRRKLMKQGAGKGGFSEAELQEYVRVCTPEQIHGVCSDYRATAFVDWEMDRAEFEQGIKVQQPALVLWGELSHTQKYYDPRAVWPRYAANIERAVALPCGHYPNEQCPEDTLRELSGFFRA
jgi:haloacetate dehalogenase